MLEKVTMTSIVIDKDRCTRCGICVNVCPQIQGWNMEFAIPNIECGLSKKTGSSEFTPTMDETYLAQVLEKIVPNCIKCGHCETFCPEGAFKLNLSLDEDCGKKNMQREIPPDYLGNYLKSRRSIRNFSSQTVEKAKIEQILDISRYAASGCNSQSVEWLVVYDKKMVHRLAELTVEWMDYLCENKDPMSAVLLSLKAAWEHGTDPICWNAPHLLIAHIPENHLSAPIDSVIALTYFDITAPAFGVGTCWVGLLTNAVRSWKPLQEAIALPQGRVISYAMVFGYPQYKTHRIPRRNPLKLAWM
jgi:nitroreductase/Pyruvate/2-oxoacid:ferredoxin oxidoreductase delta subunit